jgi:hypothetical protein
MPAVSERKPEFTREQYAEVYPEGIGRHYWYVARNAFVSGLIRWIERRHGARIGRMLEIGCGPGMVVEHLRASGRDCYGVELAPAAVPEVIADYVWAGTDCRVLPESFRAGVELILLLDVVEHIEDPVGFLVAIRNAYPNCRWLVISVPARMELWSNFDDQYGHFRRYDEAALRSELTAAGAELVRSRYHFVPLYPILYLLARSRRGRPLSNRSPSLPLLHRLLGQLIRLETWLCPRWLYGTSIVAVGRLPARGA